MSQWTKEEERLLLPELGNSEQIGAIYRRLQKKGLKRSVHAMKNKLRDLEATKGIVTQRRPAGGKGPAEPLTVDEELYRRELKYLQKEHKRDQDQLLKKIEVLSRQLKELQVVDDLSTYRIPSTIPKTGSVSTAVAIWSDWHVEEEVRPDMINGLNVFNLKIAKQRVEQLANRCVRFVKMYRRDTDIKDMMICLLGDFITGNIHEENLENCLLPPIDAMIFAEGLVASAIEFILAELPDINLTIPCAVGNHSRITRKMFHASESGNNLEYYMYHHLAKYFQGKKNVKFLITESPHIYVDVMGMTVRTFHGHQVRYGGGVGGLLVPLRKKLNEWDKAIKADLNLFGHFHQENKFGKAIGNGSLIGYNKYALDGGFEFEDPRQVFFLINGNKKKVSIYSPVMLA